MADVIFNGPAGRIEGKFHQGPHNDSPIALILHPDPKAGGTMNSKVAYALYRTFVNMGFTVLRFNFRGVGKSEGAHDNGDGEMHDAAAALDWLQSMSPHSRNFWIAGFSFGAWITMQLLMRRPEIEGFIAVSPPAHRVDFSFLAPCPTSGQVIQGTNDTIVPKPSVDQLVEKLQKQKGIRIDYEVIEGADHFFAHQLPELAKRVSTYVEKHCKNLK